MFLKTNIIYAYIIKTVQSKSTSRGQYNKPQIQNEDSNTGGVNLSWQTSNPTTNLQSSNQLSMETYISALCCYRISFYHHSSFNQLVHVTRSQTIHPATPVYHSFCDLSTVYQHSNNVRYRSKYSASTYCKNPDINSSSKRRTAFWAPAPTSKPSRERQLSQTAHPIYRGAVHLHCHRNSLQSSITRYSLFLFGYLFELYRISYPLQRSTGPFQGSIKPLTWPAAKRGAKPSRHPQLKLPPSFIN